MFAGYAVFGNDSNAPLTISAASSPDFGSVSMHETIDEGGISKMRLLDHVEIPPHTSVTFEPGGKHLMLMQPHRELKVADWVRIHFDASPGPGFDVDFSVCEERPVKGGC
jgi:copper(I)-binding protein